MAWNVRRPCFFGSERLENPSNGALIQRFRSFAFRGCGALLLRASMLQCAQDEAAGIKRCSQVRFKRQRTTVDLGRQQLASPGQAFLMITVTYLAP